MTVTGSAYQGVFGGNSGTLKNMTVTGTVSNTGTGANNSTGGIAGVNMEGGTIENCSFTGTVSGGNANQIGGITGYNYGTVINSRSGATVSGVTSVGGIAGQNQGKIENSYNTGNVSGRNQVGGIAGANSGTGSNIRIRNCYNTGDITATEPNAGFGGIVGANLSSSTVEYCYNTGNVTAQSNVGGIAGSNTAGSTIQYCISLGARINGDSNVGRIAGTSSGTLNNNKGRADTNGISGGVATATSIHGENISLGSSTSLSSVFTGFDSSTIWNINNLNTITGGALPTLKAPNTQSPAPTIPAEYVLGTAANPFLVATEADLRKVGTETTTGGWTVTAYYKQTADITVTSATNFPAIGSDTNRFTGTYDGDGKTITGLTQVTTSSNAGFFSIIGAGGTVKNVTVTGGQITQNGASAVYTGGIAGIHFGRIENCSFTGNVNGGTTGDFIGGIAGYNNNGTIINSRNFATITGRSNIGGIAGTNAGKIDNSFNRGGTVSGNSNVGGIVGTNSGSGVYIKNCYSTVEITGSQFPGGIAGNNQNDALIEYCYSTGNVIGTTGAYGISGRNSAGGTVRNCVALNPKVTTTNSASVARIASDSGTLTNNQARVDMKTGFSGSESAVPTDQTGLNSPHGANVALTALQTTVFSGWDTAIWNINTGNLSNGALPTLKPNPQSSTTMPPS